MKKLIPAFIVAILSGFMFFIYEPITMYATNVSDFWFDIYTMIKPTMLLFVGYVFCMVLGFIIVYLINKKFSSKLYVYKGLVLIAFAAVIIFYIQGNFLIKTLPSLDGSLIRWDIHLKDTVISTLLVFLTFAIVGITTYKFKYDKVAKVYSFIMCAIFIMLTTSFISTLTKEGVWSKKDRIVVLTNANINNASTNTNFYILVVDSVDSTVFDKVLTESDEYADTFKDFTYYPDTMCTYRFTRDTIPYIFYGTPNKNETEFNEYYNKAFDNSKLISYLKSNDYQINMYEYDFRWTNENSNAVDNINVLNKTMDIKAYLKEVAKYDLFKYLPYPYKMFSRIDNLDFGNCQVSEEGDKFSWDDKDFYDNILSSDIQKINDKCFNFVHLEGAHTPFNYDENLNLLEKEDGKYEQKVVATLKVINKYIERLKESGVYDNSIIIVMSDHGYDFEPGQERQNPMFYVKGLNEHHDMVRSDKPVSYADLNQIYEELLAGKTSEEILSNIDYNRKRILLWYNYNEEDHMVEYEQNGRAWEEETLVPTGKEYNR